jgi:DNA invertase Pin-like site-specific DNA recombinase
MAPDTESLRGEKMLVGYARVSTAEQNLDLQIDALEKAGCEKIFTEKMSSVKDRPVFKQTLDFIRSGDTLIIWKLDRIGRSLIDLVHIVNHLRERGISLQIITERFDTSTPEGEMLFHFYA